MQPGTMAKLLRCWRARAHRPMPESQKQGSQSKESQNQVKTQNSEFQSLVSKLPTILLLIIVLVVLFLAKLLKVIKGS
jgi:hypothetical protein